MLVSKFGPRDQAARVARPRSLSYILYQANALIRDAVLINALAFIVANSGMRDRLIAAWRENAPVVRAEAGCIEYNATTDFPDAGAFQSPVGPDTLVIIETWASIEALRAHVVAPHMKAYAEKTRDLVAGRVIRVLTSI